MGASGLGLRALLSAGARRDSPCGPGAARAQGDPGRQGACSEPAQAGSRSPARGCSGSRALRALPSGDFLSRDASGRSAPSTVPGRTGSGSGSGSGAGFAADANPGESGCRACGEPLGLAPGDACCP